MREGVNEIKSSVSIVPYLSPFVKSEPSPMYTARWRKIGFVLPGLANAMGIHINAYVFALKYNILQRICKVFNHAIFCADIVIHQTHCKSLKM